MASERTRNFGVFAGNSPLTGRLGFEIIPFQTSLGVCASSGTVGHSLSFGNSDAVVIIGENAALADATATASANLVETGDDIEKAINFAKEIPGVLAAIVIAGERFSSWGKKGFKWSLKS